MPEGGEVRVMTDKIKKLEGCKLTAVKVLGGRYERHGPPANFKALNAALPLKIKQIANKGKFVYIVLDKKWSIWITLGMSGKFRPSDKPPIKHDNILFETSCSKADMSGFYLNDMRNFGTIRIFNDPHALVEKLDELGYDPLEKPPTFTQFKTHFATFRDQKLSSLLLNQKFIAGIGNYLRADIMYCAKIHPDTRLKSINETLLKRLYDCMLSVMVDTYRSQSHGFPRSRKFIIYEKKWDKLGNPVEHRTDSQGRTVWFVPKVQKNYNLLDF